MRRAADGAGPRGPRDPAATSAAVRRARTTYLVYRSLASAMAGVPEPLAAGAAAVVGEVLARRGGTPMAMAERHLTRVLGSSSSVPPDPALVRRWARRSFRAYARYWMEGARLPTMDPAAVDDRMVVERGYEHLQAAMAAGRGVVMALPHVGSWEWGGAFLAHRGYPMTSVAEPLEPPEMFRWFVAQREALGLRIVALGADSGSTVLRVLRGGGLVGLLCDRDLPGNGIEVEFFGERTTLPAGPATLALRTGAALVVAAVYSGPRRQHTALVSAPLDTARRGGLREDARRVAQEVAGALEGLIRQAPEQWHMFQPNWPSDEPGPS